MKKRLLWHTNLDPDSDPEEKRKKKKKKEKRNTEIRNVFPGSNDDDNDSFLTHELVGALSPVNHKGLFQGWTQTSLNLQVIHFTSHHTTSHVFVPYLYSIGTQHRNLLPAGWPILFCGPTQEPVLATANIGKNWERFWKKCRWMGRVALRKKFLAVSLACMTILTYSRLYRVNV